MGPVASRIFVPNPREEAQHLNFLRVADLFDETERERVCDVQKLPTLFDDEFPSLYPREKTDLCGCMKKEAPLK